ncbi:hypothetical protein GCM10027162_54700 [Streptomyces incanus]
MGEWRQAETDRVNRDVSAVCADKTFRVGYGPQWIRVGACVALCDEYLLLTGRFDAIMPHMCPYLTVPYPALHALVSGRGAAAVPVRLLP